MRSDSVIMVIKDFATIDINQYKPWDFNADTGENYVKPDSR
jgi:hypothetical protein